MKLLVHLFDTSEKNIDDLLSLPCLKDEDFKIFEKYKDIEKKKEKIVSTYFKNKYIGEYFFSNEGKPLSKKIYFNISHSRGVVVFVMDESPIGIDIEKVRDVNDNLKNYISSQEEKEYIGDNKSFFEIWTSKESLVKCIGTGIKEKPNKIPSLPINGKKIYNGKTYFSKVVEYQGYVISVTIENSGDFDLSITKI